MRIVHLLASFVPAGAETMATELMCRLAQRHQVAAVGLYQPLGTNLEARLDAAGVPVTWIGKRRGFEPRVVPALVQAFRALRPDVVHTHSYALGYALPAYAASGVNAAVHTLHTLAHQEVGRVGRLAHGLAFRWGVRPVCVSNSGAESARQVYRRRPQVIPNGIDVARFAAGGANRSAWRARQGFGEDQLLVTSVARLSDVKDPVGMVEGFAPVARASRQAHLLLVGEGPERPAVEARVAALGLVGRVHLLGVRDDIPDVLGASDLFLLNSRFEGMPLSVLEAMAAGLPVVAPAVGGLPEVVDDGATGLLFPPGGREGLSEVLTRLLTDPNLRGRLSARAATVARERYALDAMAGAYEALYQTLAAKPRRWPG